MLMIIIKLFLTAWVSADPSIYATTKPVQQLNAKVSKAKQHEQATALQDSPAYVNQLEELYSSCGGSHWINKDGWPDGSTATDPCSSETPWFGVECSSIDDSLDVTGLELPNNNLTCSFPGMELLSSGLVNLEKIDLSGNKISGSIQSFNIFVKGITHFNVAGNSISGSLPRWLFTGSASENVQMVNVSHNNIAGTVDNTVGKLLNTTTLQTLDLSGNQFYGFLPTAMSYVKGGLYVSGNKWWCPQTTNVTVADTFTCGCPTPCHAGDPTNLHNATCSASSTNSVCQCDPKQGWSGRDCTSNSCPGKSFLHDCTGHGVCQADGKTCKCMGLWHGDACDMEPCQVGGKNTTCNFEHGWGVCDHHNGLCQCHDWFVGGENSTCSEAKCPNNCNNVVNGTYVTQQLRGDCYGDTNQCACNPDWTFADCSYARKVTVAPVRVAPWSQFVTGGLAVVVLAFSGLSIKKRYSVGEWPTDEQIRADARYLKHERDDSKPHEAVQSIIKGYVSVGVP